MGFASKLKLGCSISSCGFTKSKFSSPRIHKSNCSNVAFEINTKMVLYSHEIGKGFTSLQTFSSQRAFKFKDHDNKITDCEVESGEDMLYCTANAICQAYAETDNDIREAIERGEIPLIDISVSYDGTWQKRGFTSLYGVVL
ncbi:serine/threonine-protein kinase kinX [Biomphalaria glabrata]|nr:serine/threonine-protein kinase kinX [Biomphalaria glabrata]